VAAASGTLVSQTHQEKFKPVMSEQQEQEQRRGQQPSKHASQRFVQLTAPRSR